MRTDNVGKGSVTHQEKQHNRLGGMRQIDEFTAMCVRIKAERSLYHKFGVTTKMLNCLAVIRTLLDITGKDSVPIDTIVPFSGRARGWKADMYRTIEENIEAGTLERVVKRKGFAIRLSQQGLRVREDYLEKFSHIRGALYSDQSKRWMR